VIRALGLHPFLGLIAGSITLVGGHGSGAAYAEKFGEASGIEGVMALAMTSATLGLALGAIIGGPVAERLITRFQLASPPAVDTGGDVLLGPAQRPVTTSHIIEALTAALVAVLAGEFAVSLLTNAPVTVPDFLVASSSVSFCATAEN